LTTSLWRVGVVALAMLVVAVEQEVFAQALVFL
jgi:hypothetical protein